MVGSAMLGGRSVKKNVGNIALSLCMFVRHISRCKYYRAEPISPGGGCLVTIAHVVEARRGLVACVTEYAGRCFLLNLLQIKQPIPLNLLSVPVDVSNLLAVGTDRNKP